MASVADYYTGFSQAEVEAIFAAQKQELSKALQAYSEGGTQVTKRRLDEVNAILAACQAALFKFDPVAYPRTRKRVSSSRVVGYMSK